MLIRRSLTRGGCEEGAKLHTHSVQQARENVSAIQRLQQENETLRNEIDTSRAGYQREMEEKELQNRLLEEKDRTLQGKEETIQML